jgi:hypothetical protein
MNNRLNSTLQFINIQRQQSAEGCTSILLACSLAFYTPIIFLLQVNTLTK